MKNMKRWIALAVSVLMLVTSVFVLAEDTEEEPAPDTVFESGLRFLNALGILDTGLEEADPEAEVSRVEFGVAIGRILGNGAADGEEEPASLFGDMEGQGAEAVKAVNMMADMKLVSGTGGSAFSPDETITQEQAVKILICLLGYDIKAQEEGGYPAGYLLRGNKLGLLPGQDFRGADLLVWRNFVKLLYNALSIDIMQQTSYGEDPAYMVVKDENLMTNTMKLKILRRAMVTGNTVTRLNGGEGVDDGDVEIANMLFEDGGTDAGSYLGKLVDVYYRESKDGIRRIVCFEPSGRVEEELRIDFEDIVSVDGYTITYYSGDIQRSRRVSVAAAANMIVNGRAMAYNPSLIDTALCGAIVLEKGAAESYDLVTVSQYTNLLVDAVDFDRNVIYDKMVPGNKLDLADYISRGDLDIQQDGSSLDITDISADSMLAVYRSPDGAYISIRISEDVAMGTIEQVTEDTVIISGESYPMLDSLRQEARNRLGGECTAYLSVDGKVVWFDTTRSGVLKYGYMIQGAGISAFDDVVTLRMLTEDGKIEALDVSGKVRLNGVRVTANAAEAVRKLLSNGGVWEQQLVQYKLNSDNEIIELNTAKTGSRDAAAGPEAAGDPRNPDQDWTYDFYLTNPKSNIRYKSGGQTFGMKFSINSETKIFVVSPSNEIDEKAFEVMSVSHFTNDSFYDVAGYNADEGGVVEALVCWEEAKNITPKDSSALVLVDYVSTGLDEDGFTVPVLHGLADGKFVEYPSNGDIQLSTGERELKRGDVVRVELDRNSKVAGIKVDVNIDTQKTAGGAFGGVLSQNWAIAGAVYSIENGYALMSNISREHLGDIDFTDPNNLYSVKLSGTVMVYDETTDEVYAGSVQDLLPYKTAGESASRFLAKFNYESLKTLIVFKYKD